MSPEGQKLTLSADGDIVTLTTACSKHSFAGRVADGRLQTAQVRTEPRDCVGPAGALANWISTRIFQDPSISIANDQLTLEWADPDKKGDESHTLRPAS